MLFHLDRLLVEARAVKFHNIILMYIYNFQKHRCSERFLYFSVSVWETESPILTKPCHYICPVSLSTKQSMIFSELLCFLFSVTDKKKMNQGIFLGETE